jgi:hypothetical protein
VAGIMYPVLAITDRCGLCYEWEARGDDARVNARPYLWHGTCQAL